VYSSLVYLISTTVEPSPLIFFCSKGSKVNHSNVLASAFVGVSVTQPSVSSSLSRAVYSSFSIF
jgi:hypothetical protein